LTRQGRDRSSSNQVRADARPSTGFTTRWRGDPDFATLTSNTIRLPGAQATFDKLAEPTQLQARALELVATAPVIA
jgi:hypothetical protein